MTSERPVALLAVADKRGLVVLARGLARLGWDLAATTGTASLLREAGIAVGDVTDSIGLPTLLGGRLKSLHHRVFGGLLRRSGNVIDDDEAHRFEFLRIDLLVNNFYPFDRAVTAGLGEIELIDVGGPSMLRAAAKNYANVVPLADPEDYSAVLSALELSAGDPRGISFEQRRALAAHAFSRTSAYDAAISKWLSHPAASG